MSCGTGGAGRDCGPPDSRADIVITVAGPAVGRHATVTSAILASARQQVLAINAAGGINGEQLTVEAADDGCDADKAVALATGLATRKVALVLGHPCDAAAVAAAKIYAAQSSLFIATATRHPALTTPRAGATVFRLSGRDDKHGEDAGRYLATAFKGQTIAIVHDRTKYARTIADAAAATLAKSGAPPPITATLIAGEKDFPLVTAKIKGAAAIFYAGFPLEAGLLHQQLITAGSKAAVLFSASIATAEFAGTFGTIANGNGAKGVRVMLPRFAFGDDTAERDPTARNVAAQSTLTATAIAAFAAAATLAKSNDAQKIAAHLAGTGIATPPDSNPGSNPGSNPDSNQLPITFDRSGDALRPSFDVYSWNGTHWER